MSADPHRPIHVWAPGIRDDSGGIQAFSRFFVSALREGFPERPIRVFVKNERLDSDDPLLSANVDLQTLHNVPGPLRSAAMAALGVGLAVRERPACTLSTHLHFFTALKLLRSMTGIPYGGVLHGIEAWKISSSARVRALREADRLMAVSDYTRQRVVEDYRVNPEHVSVVPNTFNSERYTPGPKPLRLLERYGLKPGQPVLLTVSRLALSERYKGHWQVLIAMGLIRKVIPDIHYIIVGTGDERAHLEVAVKSLGLAGAVTFAGFVPTTDLPDHYRLCDAFVMPSTKEGFGIVFLEAAACGKPAIGGMLDGSMDALDHGKLGILIDPHSPQQIADAVVAAVQKKHDNQLLFDPAALSRAVTGRFGFQSFKARLIEEVAPLLEPGSKRTWTGVQAPPFSTARPVPATRRAPRIVVLTQLNSPYQVEFFNHVAQLGTCHLEVIYLTDKDKNRQWVSPDIAHSHIILSETPDLRRNAMESLASADISILNYYTDRFAWEAIRTRAATGKPWVFWGERPGFLQLGPPGMWFRKLALRPLHRSRAPIWGVGEFGIDGYRVEFGQGHVYHNMPYYSNLERFHCDHDDAGPVRTLIYSGSLSERKGSELLARAFVVVAKEQPSLRLCLVGDGPLREEMRKTLSPVADRVEWAGFQSWDSLPKFYACGDIFCFPSRYDGWGLALVEALASGLPVIGTDQTGAAIDLIRPGKNGWLIKTDDLAGLTQTLRDAVGISPERLARMRANAIQSVCGHTVVQGARNFTTSARQVIASWNQP